MIDLSQAVVVASVSGGKDSTAMCLHLREIGVDYTPVYIDTGWENAETYRYLRDELPRYVGEITWLRLDVELPDDLEALARVYEARLGHDSAMVRMCLRKGMFPAGTIRWCTQELKVRPMGRFLDGLDAEPVNAVGIRAEESRARSCMPEWEEVDGNLLRATVWRPIIGWTADDVVAIHQRHGVVPNRSYFQGASRVGCWPCIRSNKAEIRLLADVDPARVDLLRDLEADIARLAEARHLARGTTLEAEGHHAPSWFQTRDDPRKVTRCPDCEGKGCQACDGKGRRRVKLHDASCWPIDRVVEWSRTADGGRTMELFGARPAEFGCMRWGMCDVGGAS